MNALKKGSIVYKLRHGTAEQKIEIDSVTDYTAYSGESKFKREYEGTKVIQISERGVGRMLFGETFVVADLETIDKLENEIRMRYIRNTDYSKFSHDEIVDIQNFLKRIVDFKALVK